MVVADFDILCYDEGKVRRVEEWLLAEGFTNVHRAAGGSLYDLHARLEAHADTETYPCVWASGIARNIMDGPGGVATIHVNTR